MRLSHLPERKKDFIVFYKHSAPRSARLFRGDRNVVFAAVKVFSGFWHPIRAISDQPAQLPRKSSRERCQNLDSEYVSLVWSLRDRSRNYVSKRVHGCKRFSFRRE